MKSFTLFLSMFLLLPMTHAFAVAPPVAMSANDVTTSSFTANWTEVPLNNGYILMVASDPAFNALIPGYDSVRITNTHQSVTGLQNGATYYYKLRAIVGFALSEPSNTVTVQLAGAVQVNNPPAPVEDGSSNCSQRVLRRIGVSPPGMRYYWQNQVGGNSTSLGYGETLDVPQSGTYYLRAYHVLSSTWATTTTAGIAVVEYHPNTSTPFVLYGSCHDRIAVINSVDTDVYSLYRGNTLLASVHGDQVDEGDPLVFESVAAGVNYQVKVAHVSCSNHTELLQGNIDIRTEAAPILQSSNIVVGLGESARMEIQSPKEGVTYQWYDSEDSPGIIATGPVFEVEGVVADRKYFVGATNSYDCSSLSRTEVQLLFDHESAYNWIQTTQFDDQGKIGESRQYFDLSGKLRQSQVRNLSDNELLVSETLYDKLQRPSLQTLSAPSNQTEFALKQDFITTTGLSYTAEHWDKQVPDPVDASVSGSLGYYYSDNNAEEPLVDKSQRPFIKTLYDADGSGQVKTSVGPLEGVYEGIDLSAYARTFPVTGELDGVYLAVRNALLGYDAGTLHSKIIKQVSRDANGKEQISFVDEAGKVLASAIGNDEGAYAVAWELTFNYTHNPTTSDHAVLDFHVPEGSTVSSGSSDVINLISDEVSAGSLGQGFYRMNNPTNFNYSYRYYNPSFNFYDDLGRLLVSVPPNGVKNLLSPSLAINPSVVTQIPFATYYKYDHQGRLIEMSEPDAGVTRYIYRRDGSIRFSENSLQRLNGTFSYTNYDRLGRPVESGEYIGDDFAYDTPELLALLEVTQEDGGLILNATDRKDWIRTTYDLPDTEPGRAINSIDEIRLSEHTDGFTHIRGKKTVRLLSGFHYRAPEPNGELRVSTDESAAEISPVPEFAISQNFTHGAVSYTENASTKTWYSYDHLGRVETMYAWYKDLFDAPKQISYTYDLSGNVLKISYQKGAVDQFFHTYTYDADRRLSKVYASPVESEVDNAAAVALQASYLYYTHGPLKRIELAGNLQGIDYTYNILGQLKAINNPDDLSDESGFEHDVFAQTFEYFSGDYARSGSITQKDPVNPVYNGNIAGVRWKSIQTNGTTKSGNYQYDYDDRDYLSNAVFNGGESFKVSGLTYDPNGNIRSLQRKNAAGSISDDFSNYQYKSDPSQESGAVGYNTNQLAAIPGYSSWEYDAIGQMSRQIHSDGNESRPTYDITGKVVAVKDINDQIGLSYAYDDRGFRIRKTDHASAGKETVYVRDASGNVMAIYDKAGGYQLKEVPVYGASRLGTYYKQSGDVQYELKDHLGNVRSLVSRLERDRTYTSDYYPFGSVMRSGGQPGRYGYQGDFAEWDEETELSHFELRAFDARVGRWMVPDPYRQFASPYNGMGNNPVYRMDPDGGCATGDADCINAALDAGFTSNADIDAFQNWEGLGVEATSLEGQVLNYDLFSNMHDLGTVEYHGVNNPHATSVYLDVEGSRRNYDSGWKNYTTGTVLTVATMGAIVAEITGPLNLSQKAQTLIGAASGVAGFTSQTVQVRIIGVTKEQVQWIGVKRHSGITGKTDYLNLGGGKRQTVLDGSYRIEYKVNQGFPDGSQRSFTFSEFGSSPY